MPGLRAGKVELALQVVASDQDDFMVISALTWPSSVISAGKLTPARTISLAYVWRLCRMRHRRHYAASRTMPRVDVRTPIHGYLNRGEAA